MSFVVIQYFYSYVKIIQNTALYQLPERKLTLSQLKPGQSLKTMLSIEEFPNSMFSFVL